VTIAQIARQGLARASAGNGAGVFVFDDASTPSSGTSSRNGKLEIDPTSAVGIWLDFAKTHPGWKNRAVFCMLNGGAAGTTSSATSHSSAARRRSGGTRR
jgi:hypothetical protein